MAFSACPAHYSTLSSVQIHSTIFLEKQNRLLYLKQDIWNFSKPAKSCRSMMTFIHVQLSRLLLS